MLFVNLITTHRCSRTKYSLTKVIGGLTLFTVLIFSVAFLIRVTLKSTFVNENIIILLGLTYFFPLKYIYNESTDRILSIMFFSWIHTMTVTSISIQIVKLSGIDNPTVMALALQTTIYIFTTPIVIKFVKSKFIFILNNISNRMNKYFIILSFIQFISLLIVHLYFKETTNLYWRIILVMLIALTAIISYHLIYIIVNNLKSINYLKHLAFTDALTGIKNRLSLFHDCDRLINANKSFTIIYMDLNKLKKVNDTYGHSVGDDYLKQFVKATIDAIGDKGSLYRMSGDEFVCIYRDDIDYYFLTTFCEKIMKLFKMHIPFLGVSIGYANFPKDAGSLDRLIKHADLFMYKVKNVNTIDRER